MIKQKVLPIAVFICSIFISTISTLTPAYPAQGSSQPKASVTWGGSPIGKTEVTKVGFWCDVGASLFTYGAFGPTQEKAEENARSQCHKMFPKDPCKLKSCKSANDDAKLIHKKP